MINLFERYNQATETLYHSMLEAGMNHLTIVLKDDGFLPEAVTSPYRFFAENEIKPEDRALYFNEVQVPRYWNIEGDNNQAVITDMGQVHGKIYYHIGDKQRIVNNVDWMDAKGFVRYRDHYDQFGIRFAQTTYDLRGVAILKEYFNRDGETIIYVNHTTGNHVLTWHGKDYFFESEVDFTLFYLDMTGVSLNHFVINHLGTPLSVLYHLKNEGQDYVVWQENLNGQSELPGNMRLILNESDANQSLRQFTLIVPDSNEYDWIQQQVSTRAQQYVKQGGYSYALTRHNHFANQVLLMTNSDQIEQIDEIISVSPHLTFHIGALTEMSSKLMALERFENVKLYPSIEKETIEYLYQHCDIYLDINSGNEILDAVRHAFMADMLIFAYRETAHNLNYVRNDEAGTVFPFSQYHALIQLLHQCVDDHKQWRALLEAQKQHAHMIAPKVFKGLFNI